MYFYTYRNVYLKLIYGTPQERYILKKSTWSELNLFTNHKYLIFTYKAVLAAHGGPTPY